MHTLLPLNIPFSRWLPILASTLDCSCIYFHTRSCVRRSRIIVASGLGTLVRSDSSSAAPKQIPDDRTKEACKRQDNASEQERADQVANISAVWQMRVPSVELEIEGNVEQRDEQWQAGDEVQDSEGNIANDLVSAHGQ